MRVGIIGFGFMGRMHHRCWTAIPGAEVAAICDADPAAVTDSSRGRGNIAGAEATADLEGVEIYSDVGEMLARERLDAVSITVPTHLHARWSIAALDAGVHVLCEKPMALTVEDGLRMIEAAERGGKILQIGHCIRFWPEYAKAREIIAGGSHGRVIAATFGRFAATAHVKAGGWFTDQGRSGGMALDLHIHDSDFIQHVFGLPRSVVSRGASGSAGGIAHICTQYRYDDDKLVSAEGGWAMTPSFGFVMRFHVVMENATIAFEHGRSPSLRLCPANGEPSVPAIGGGDGYSRQIAHFAARVRGETVEPVITPRQALDSLRMVQAELESASKGAEVALDWVKT